MGGSLLSTPYRFLAANLNVIDESLAPVPPTHVITLASLTTCASIVLYQHGKSTLRSARQLIKWAYRVGLKTTCQYYTIQIAKALPWMRKKLDRDIQKQTDEMIFQVETEWNDLLDSSARLPENKHHVLPERTTSSSQLLSLLTKWSRFESERWNKGQASGAIYHGGNTILEFLSQVYGLFSVTNPLHPDLFPYVRKMEGEIVQMLIGLFHGTVKNANIISTDDDDLAKNENTMDTANKSADCCGTLTSGGTESILLACKAYRDRARHLYNITSPEIIAPTTIHAAFEKAAHYFGMKLILIDVDEKTSIVKVEDVRRAITKNTVLLAGSAPNFPHGIIDPIEELACLAYENNIGFHSDCCLGGLILPFVDKLQQLGRLDCGNEIGSSDSDDSLPEELLPIFDFRAKGVTSISADMHKYGYAPKGSSVVLYSSSELRHYQYFVSLSWTGGIYASPTLAGSRPGGISAATWAVMVHLGVEGYLDITEGIIKTARAIKRGIRDGIDGLEVIGDPLSSVVAFRSTVPTLNIYGIGQAMTHKGWNLNSLQYPSCLHICCTNLHRGKDKQFLNDLRDAVHEVKSHPSKYSQGTAAIYGMAHSLPDSTLLEPIARGFVDAFFTG
jgi:sphinganine-1-phosphate aldolase